MRIRPLLLTLLFLGAFRALHADDLTSEVIYKSADRKAAAFVPLSVIERGLADAPMAPEDRAYLAHRIEVADAAGGCSEAISAHGGTVRDEDRRTPERIMAESKGLFVGEVQAVVTGWSTLYRNPVTVVWVSPVSILENAEGRLDGERFALVIARAGMQVGNKRLCNTSGPPWVPVKGARILVSAGEHSGDGRMFQSAHYFPMTGDQVRPMPFLDVRPFQPTSLETLKTAAAREKEQVRQ